MRKIAVADANEELLGTAVEFADPDLLRFGSFKLFKINRSMYFFVF